MIRNSTIKNSPSSEMISELTSSRGSPRPMESPLDAIFKRSVTPFKGSPSRISPMDIVDGISPFENASLKLVADNTKQRDERTLMSAEDKYN